MTSTEADPLRGIDKQPPQSHEDATMQSRLDDPLDTTRPLIVFLGDDIDEEDHNLLFPALRQHGVAVIRVHPHDLVVELSATGTTFTVAGHTLRPDLVVGWVLDELLIPGMAHLDVLQRAGIPVINDALTLFRAQNKYLDSSLLSHSGALGYPVITGRDPAALETWLRELDGPAVIKPLVGFGGRGLRRIEGEQETAEFLQELRQEGGAYYAVPWVENPGRDIRVYTINHHPVFAMYRYAPPGKWITNVRAGGGVAMCPLTPEIAALARRASAAAGTLIGGVDIGEDQASGELVVYEVNSCPTCEPPVLVALADFLAAAVRDLDAAREHWRPARVHVELDRDPALFHPGKRLIQD